MVITRTRSVYDPASADALRLAVEAVRRAEAMGLMARGMARVDDGALRLLARAVRRAGIASAAAEMLDQTATPSRAELARLLEAIIAALEASPAPAHEWKALAQVFPADDLAALLDVSLSSLKRYQSGERETPDLVAARLHFLALVVGDLAGSYNDTGVRRWFQRKRTQLDNRTPGAVLERGWDPDDDGPQRVRALARSLVTLSST